MKQHRVVFQVVEAVDDNLERLPTTYRVFSLEIVDKIEHAILHESLETSSFQAAMQAFINRLRP